MLFGIKSCNVQTPPFRSRAAIFTMRSGIEAYPNDTLFQVSLCNAYGSAASSIITASSLQTCRISQKCRFWLKIGSTLYTIMANNFQWCLTMFIGPISMPLDIRKSIAVQVLKRWVKKCATRRETSSECVALRIAFGILRAWQNCIGHFQISVRCLQWCFSSRWGHWGLGWAGPPCLIPVDTAWSYAVPHTICRGQHPKPWEVLNEMVTR